MNDSERWSKVDEYLVAKLAPPDATLAAALKDSNAAGLPAISVAPNQGKMLELLARIAGARRILEIGTLGGYSTIWLARALPADGHLITLELEPKHAEVARRNLARAGFAERTEVRVGPAQESLERLISEGAGPFDFIFIYADKKTYPEDFTAPLELSRPGTVIIADNVVRGGAVADPDSKDENVQGVLRFYDLVAAANRVSATAVQTVGSKGHDGFALMVVTGDGASAFSR